MAAPDAAIHTSRLWFRPCHVTRFIPARRICVPATVERATRNIDRTPVIIGTLLTLLTIFALAQHEGMQHDHHTDVMKHGAEAMGFDQTTTSHHFLLQNQGGAVQVTANDARDNATIQQIRAHLQAQAKNFKAGDFGAPQHTHGVTPPGVDVMKARAAKITYRYEEIAAGARLNIATSDPDALHAVHDFLRFQIKDHQTGDPTTVR
jgi:hypothetical protein